jgi:aryl-alcohol dehydrogenase-like predicted oxidoreductase
MGPQSEKHRKMAMKLDEIAKKKDTAITSIALAYVMHKAPVRCTLSRSTDDH